MTISMLEFMNIFLMSLSFLYCIKMKNPVKMSMVLMGISSLIFFKMYTLSSNVWFPMIFFLIFMGGILMMFMILSSVLPNENNFKLKGKISKLYIMFFLLSTLMLPEMSFYEQLSVSTKSFLDSSSSMILMIILMLGYFFISITMISKEESPMRKVMCQNKFNLVN